MRAISHGSTSGPSTKKTADDVLNGLGDDLRNQYFFDRTDNTAPSFPICHLFPELAADKDKLVPETEKTLDCLTKLGESMLDKTDDFMAEFTAIPSAYTYFSQLVNHDITFTDVMKPDGITDAALLADPLLKPWSDEMIAERVTNKRERVLELDCVYGSMQAGVLPPRDLKRHDLMALGRLFDTDTRSLVENGFFDLVRCPISNDREKDRTALIADRRNDSNIVLSQLQVAFLRAHNEIIELDKCSFVEAQSTLRKIYQSVVRHDFLPKIVPEKTINEVLANPKPMFDATRGVPFEFSMGAFRFGHGMIRRAYYLNDRVRKQGLLDLFTPMALSNSVTLPQTGVGFPTLPANRKVKWAKFVKTDNSNSNANEFNVTRSLRPQMVDPLFELFDDTHVRVPGLAVQDLKRAYMMRIPTGQALAERLEIPEQDRLTTDDMKTVVSEDQFQILTDSAFLERTPLPFYVLAEAAKANANLVKEERGKLGPVGARIVAEVVIGILRTIPGSCVNDPSWEAKHGTFVLKDLLQLAKVL